MGQQAAAAAHPPRPLISTTMLGQQVGRPTVAGSGSRRPCRETGLTAAMRLVQHPSPARAHTLGPAVVRWPPVCDSSRARCAACTAALLCAGTRPPTTSGLSWSTVWAGT